HWAVLPSFGASDMLIDLGSVNRIHQAPTRGITLNRGTGIMTRKVSIAEFVDNDIRYRNCFQQTTRVLWIGIHRRVYSAKARLKIELVRCDRGDNFLRRGMCANPCGSLLSSPPSLVMIKEAKVSALSGARSKGDTAQTECGKRCVDLEGERQH